MAALTMVVSGCATATAPRPRVRQAVPGEQARILGLLVPLLEAADLGPSPRCPIELGVALTDTIAAVVDDSPWCADSFALSVSEGALRALAELELQAMLAHEVGHLACDGRGPACSGPRTRGGSRDVDEVAADRYAAGLLRRVGGRPACVALARLFDRLAQDPRTYPNWLSNHRPPARRARATRAACEGDR